jgi:molybdopterin-biosynthesis enzyme MoeA-like protein
MRSDVTATSATGSPSDSQHRAVVETAAVLVVGNELLSGKVQDQNLVELARTLRVLGIQLECAVFVMDEPPAIARELRALSARHGVVFTSGGVGPTHDDVTIASAALAFDVPVVQHPELEAVMRSAYGDACDAVHLSMARTPEGAHLAYGPPAEGTRVNWPVVVMRNVWLLPGIPELFRAKLAIVRHHLRGPRPFFSRSVLTKWDEPELLPLLNAVVAAHPEVEVGSYPRFRDPECKTQITFDARSEAPLEAAVHEFIAALADR